MTPVLTPFSRFAAQRGPVRAAVIGAGTFGAGIIAQSANVPALRICAVVDRDLEAARAAYARARIDPGQIANCSTAAQVQAAFEAGRYVVTQDADLLFDQSFDVVAEATGLPEAGARHARAAIAHGKHVAMVTKEADAAVGPILKHLADRAGVVYTAVDGDQHGQLMALVQWAREIGLEILCGGKSLDSELIYTPSPTALSYYGKKIPLTPDQMAAFAPMRTKADGSQIRARAAALGHVGGAKPWDLVELTIAANATGLSPDVPQTHCPPIWTGEIPSVLCPREMGGILSGPGIIDCVQILRQSHEASLAGGVFLVVRVAGGRISDLVSAHGPIDSTGYSTGLILRPHHLLGMEAITSILTAGFLHTATGTGDYRPRFDVVYETTRALPAGHVVGDDHSTDLSARIIPSVHLSAAAPLPAGLARGNRLLCDVVAGTMLTGAMVERPANSALWGLRGEQETTFK